MKPRGVLLRGFLPLSGSVSAILRQYLPDLLFAVAPGLFLNFRQDENSIAGSIEPFFLWLVGFPISLFANDFSGSRFYGRYKC